MLTSEPSSLLSQFGFGRATSDQSGSWMLVEFPPESTMLWDMSPPSKSRLTSFLVDAINDVNGVTKCNTTASCMKWGGVNVPGMVVEAGWQFKWGGSGRAPSYELPWGLNAYNSIHLNVSTACSMAMSLVRGSGVGSLGGGVAAGELPFVCGVVGDGDGVQLPSL